MGTASATAFSIAAKETTRSKPRIWMWPNLLSLDAPAVAVLWQILFLRSFHTPIELVPVLLLALTVWLIYAADRTLDAFAGERGTPRHRFYRDHWPVLAPVWLAGFGTACWLSLTELPSPLLQWGLLLLGVVAFYFVIVHYRHGWIRMCFPGKIFPKEAAVGVLFALGSSLGAWERIHTAADVCAVILLSALCWINCSAIDQWEAQPARASGDDRVILASVPLGVLSLGIAAAALFVFVEQRPVLASAEMASALSFLWLDRARPKLSADATRVLADAVLLSPLLLLPIAGHI